jgi:hypothetical protein
MDVKIVRTLPEEGWRQFVQTNPQGNIFHSPEMFEVFSKADGHRPILWAALDREKQPRALLLVVETTLLAGLLSRLTTRALAYGGVLYDPGPAGEAALEALLQAYGWEKAGEALFTELRHLSSPSPIQHILLECGYSHEEHLNYLIDLERTPGAILQGMGRRTRKQIRRGLRQGTVRIEELARPDQLKSWYALLRRTYDAVQIPLADLTLFEAAFETLYPKDMIKFLVARVGDACVAASAELIYGDRIYGWYSSVDRDYASHVPNELLMWHILRWGAENGYRLYDFGGAGKPDEDYGVRDFKSKFGGELFNFGRDTFIHKPRTLWLSQHGYEIWRRLRFSTRVGGS